MHDTPVRAANQGVGEGKAAARRELVSDWWAASNTALKREGRKLEEATRRRDFDAPPLSRNKSWWGADTHSLLQPPPHLPPLVSLSGRTCHASSRIPGLASRTAISLHGETIEKGRERMISLVEIRGNGSIRGTGGAPFRTTLKETL